MEASDVNERVDDAYSAIVGEQNPPHPNEMQNTNVAGSNPGDHDTLVDGRRCVQYQNFLPAAAGVSEEAYNEAYAVALERLVREKQAVATIIRAWQRFSVPDWIPISLLP